MTPIAGFSAIVDAVSARARVVSAALAFAALVVSGAACSAPPAAPPAPGDPGSPGPCGISTTRLVNPVDWRHDLVVLEPTGVGQPWTGGSCDDAQRPGAFVAHGYVGNFVEGYQGMVDHLVSNGFVVVFPGYTVDFDPDHQYDVVDTGFVVGAEHSGRIDLDRIGVVGHSFGGGMTQWLVQQAASRGWGSEATWVVNFAPWFSLFVGEGTIDLPEHTRYTMVSYENDYFVDTRIAIDIHQSLDIPESQRQHVVVYSDRTVTPSLEADHLGPVSVDLVPGLGTISTDHVDRWSTYRSLDATSRCSLQGAWCDVDLSDMGTWPDGRAVTPAVVRHAQPDVGPPALQECEFFLNPRPCP